MEALTQARERQEAARRLNEQKCEEAAEAGTMFNGIMKDTDEKAEALDNTFKTVTMRAESLATTEADLSKPLLDCQEDTQKHLNELAAQLSQQNTSVCSPQ